MIWCRSRPLISRAPRLICYSISGAAKFLENQTDSHRFNLYPRKQFWTKAVGLAPINLINSAHSKHQIFAIALVAQDHRGGGLSVEIVFPLIDHYTVQIEMVPDITPS